MEKNKLFIIGGIVVVILIFLFAFMLKPNNEINEDENVVPEQEEITEEPIEEEQDLKTTQNHCDEVSEKEAWHYDNLVDLCNQDCSSHKDREICFALQQRNSSWCEIYSQRLLEEATNDDALIPSWMCYYYYGIAFNEKEFCEKVNHEFFGKNCLEKTS